VQVSLLYTKLDSFGFILRSGIVGPYGSSVFSLLNTLHIDFHGMPLNLA
jgi:hypothetical protein